MSLSPSECRGLQVAGFALAEGVARASENADLRATLVVCHHGRMQCIPLEAHLDAMTHVAVLLHAVGATVPQAALLEEQICNGQRTLQVSAWVDGGWRYQIALPFRTGHTLHVRPERIIGTRPHRADVNEARDEVYSGVSTHPDGLRAWVNAVIDV